MVKNLLIATGADGCWIAALFWWWTLSGSLMANCWSFTIAATKNAQKDHFLTHVGGDSLIFTCSSSWNGWVSVLQNAWFYAPIFIRVDTMNIFHQWTRKVHRRSRQGGNWQDRQACTYGRLWRHHYIMTSKEHLNDGHILSIFLN